MSPILLARPTRALAVALFLVVPALGQVHEQGPLVPDQWSPNVTWRTPDGRYAAGVHATSMPDGRVLFIGSSRAVRSTTAGAPSDRTAFLMTPSSLAEPWPAEVVVDVIDQPVDATNAYFPPYLVNDDLFCSGHTLMGDGSFFSAGGTRLVIDVNRMTFAVLGLPYATRFDGSRWDRVGADLVGVGATGTPARWYSTCTRLADGRILVMGGYDTVLPLSWQNLSAEVFDPGTGVWSLVSPFPSMPLAAWNRDYSHVLTLPDPIGPYDVLVFGEAGVPVLFSTSGAWSVRPNTRPGTLPGEAPNAGASTVMLPLRLANGEWGYSNGSALIAGGTHGSTHQRSADVYEPVHDAWGRVDLGLPRHHPSTVLLPDGRVLIVAGHAMPGGTSMQRAQYVDPARGFSVSTGASVSGTLRGYHTVALLLPDGRVLVGGGQGRVTGDEAEKTHFQIYSPDYVGRRRPAILSAPGSVAYGETVGVTVEGQPPAEVVLMSLGSMTHSFDANQRAIQIELLGSVPAGRNKTFSLVEAPLDPRTAPPGPYMLFVLDDHRVPSEAAMIQLGP